MTTEVGLRARIRKLEANLHALIRSRVGALVDAHGVVLPRLSTPLPTQSDAAWFPVDGMYGGFRYWTEGEPSTPKLVCESWSRVDEGSGQRHEITEFGSVLVDEGFV